MAENAAIFHTTSIVLDWDNVVGANLYSIQVSVYPDFRTALESSNALANSTHSFTDSGADDSKRYWRWRSSTDSGTTWSHWSEAGSYWLNSDLTAGYTPAQGGWALVDPDDQTDAYVFGVAPRHTIVERSINRVKERNRQGELLSEYLTTKASISLEFPEDGFMNHEQFRELCRFHTEIKTFFLVANTDNGRDHVTRIWKVQVVEDPALTMLAAGREDLLTGTVELEEV
jgi:hypothetical protein